MAGRSWIVNENKSDESDRWEQHMATNPTLPSSDYPLFLQNQYLPSNPRDDHDGLIAD